MADLVKKDIRYLSRDFGSLKQNLIDFAKNYFPNTYQDFNETSPGMMFLEMAAYVGDVLSYCGVRKRYTVVTIHRRTHATGPCKRIFNIQFNGFAFKQRLCYFCTDFF